MTVEAMPGGQLEKKDISLLPDYPACGGHPGSSSHNWVPVDYLSYRLSKLLGITDEDFRKKQSKSSIIPK